MITRYFQSLNFELVEGTHDLYAVYFGKESWYICSYQNRDLYKKNIVAVTNKILNVHTSTMDWEFHHIVEKQHVEELPLNPLKIDSIKTLYLKEIPTVILHKDEHRTLSKFLHFREFKELYRSGNNNATIAQQTSAFPRQKAASEQLFNTRERQLEAHKLVDNMIDMYRNAYVGHAVFQTISSNFLTAIKAAL